MVSVNTPDREYQPDLINPDAVEELRKQGIKSGQYALIAAGIQLEFAAHLMQLVNTMSGLLVLRAPTGQMPVFDRPIAPKPHYIKTKTSQNQGFMNGLLATETRFSRVDGADAKRSSRKLTQLDKINLAKQPHESGYIHKLPVRVSLEDIYQQLISGDLQIYNYDSANQQLILKFKPNKGDPQFASQGQFVISLDPTRATKAERHRTRPWLATNPSDINSYLNNNPVSIPNHILLQLRDRQCKVQYRTNVGKDDEKTKLHNLTCMSLPPSNILELAEALTRLKNNIGTTKFNELYNHIFKYVLNNIQEQDTEITYERAIIELEKVPGALQYLFDHTAKPVASDWDGLFLAPSTTPEVLATLGIDDPVYTTTVFNTFHTQQQIEALDKATSQLFHNLQNKIIGKQSHLRTRFEQQFIKLYYELVVTEQALSSAGVVTPYEFLLQQVSNYAYGLPQNTLLGEMSPKEPATKRKLITHAYVHKQHDPNAKMLFQHGFDYRNPNGVEPGGAWLLFTAYGQVYSGDKPEQLCTLLLADGGKLIKQQFIDVPSSLLNPSTVVGKGWIQIVQKQIMLGQAVSSETAKKYMTIVEQQIRSNKKITPKTPIVFKQAPVKIKEENSGDTSIYTITDRDLRYKII